MDHEEMKDITYATFESVMMHMQKINRRLSILAGLAILLVVIMFAGLMYFLSNFELTAETVTIDSSNGAANYVGNDNNGEIINGTSGSEEDNN